MRSPFAAVAATLLLTSVALAQQSAPTINGLAAQAEVAAQAHQYAQAASLTAQAVALAPPDERAGLLYNQACYLARDNHPAQAIAIFQQAVNAGDFDSKQAAADADLASLHTNPAWPVLLAQMNTLQQREDRHWGTAAFSTPYAPNLPDADKLAGLSLLWAQAKFGFANFWHVPQLDWDATYRAYIPQVLATHSTADYYRVLQRFYVQLQDGHTNVYPPEALPIERLPIGTERIGDHVFLSSRQYPPFDLQSLHPGDELLQINGTPVLTWAAKNVEPYVSVSASSPQDRINRTYTRLLFFTAPGTVFHLTFQTPQGVQSQHTFTVPAHLTYPHSPFEFHMLPGNIAYVALNEFEDNQDIDLWLKQWPQLSQAHAIILDLRKKRRRQRRYW